MKLGLNIFRYKIGETKGFPFDITTSENVIGLEGSYAVAIGHADNVRQLHEQLLERLDTSLRTKVQQISQDVAYLTGVYPEIMHSSERGKNVTKNNRRQKIEYSSYT